jgi:D-arabinan exo alpha-(1,3)/(1,5)-arabinofuranosidase (non-reducing end)
MKYLSLLILLGVLPGIAVEAQTTLTYPDLVQRLTNLQHLAKVPPPGETTRQWSSYDRHSYYDTATGKYVDWDANDDGTGIIRMEGTNAVLAEMKGPGCIYRIWSAAPKDGHVKIYLDDASTPVVDLPFQDYFDGKHKPFTRPALVNIVSDGCNNYTPIPYQKSCKIIADPGWGLYYHFDYTTFPEGTQVPTFSRQLSATDDDALDRANRILSHCGPRAMGASDEENDLDGTLRANGGTLRKTLKGPAAIVGIRVRLDLPPSPADRDVLRQITLQVRWDGEPSPSVWAPFGDFFGTAPGANPYRSLPCGLTKDGVCYANWYMPFAKNAEIIVKNEGPQSHHLKLEIISAPLHGDVSKFARFHAKWHRDAFLPARPDRAIDWTLLKTRGVGRFVGVELHIWNPRGGWWGEGDEKYFVDGEKFPSTYGTGSEDYFGYAWGDPALFQNAFHDQTYNSGDNRGHISVNRWLIADQVPFQKSFEGDIEKYFSNSRPTLYDCMVYWYLKPGGDDPYTPVPSAQRLSYYVQPPTPKVPGATEGEKMKVLSRTGGDPHVQDMSGFGDKWSNDAQLWWTGAHPGNRLELALPVAKSGDYRLVTQLTKARDYGVVQLALDGKMLGGSLDLYNPSVIPSGQLDLGTYDLSAGKHTLTVKIIGANENAVKSYMFGLDYVRLIPVK